MLILLPPSETKAEGGEGPPLDLAALGFPELTKTRARLTAALIRLSGNRKASRAALGLSPRQGAEIARNAELASSPTMAAHARYTGVLYDALDAPALSADARRSLLIASALYGVLRADDPIPAYRLSGASTLPRIGGLGRIWRPTLTRTLAACGPILDLRSGDYARLAPLPDALVARIVARDGSVVSHHNKVAKGLLARAVASSGAETLADVLEAASAAGLEAARTGERSLDVTHSWRSSTVPLSLK
jgi:uncharacterized protein